ncbi:hypothetical protein [Deinococcus radiophilus]|uniref:hypothetical protein n=1 Tax=Deinococcus radiophilus TaxID=32062 RepID=UPI001473E96F|nr:hypothetical protein [Deinococcus radiophilus]UFA51085.1 hypothetical protein LMT64_04090 [Deinococcus radiophilus]
MEHPEYVTYVVIVYAVTFGLLAAYLLWLWRRLKTERAWAARHRPVQQPSASFTPEEHA